MQGLRLKPCSSALSDDRSDDAERTMGSANDPSLQHVWSKICCRNGAFAEASVRSASSDQPSSKGEEQGFQGSR